MARLVSVGYELNTVSSSVEFSASIGTGEVLEAQQVRSGLHGYRANRTSTAGDQSEIVFSSGNVTAPVYFRFYLRLAVASTGQIAIFLVQNGSAANKVGIRINTNNTLELWNEEDGAQVDVDSSALSVNVWYLIELKVDTTTIASTSVQAFIDGVSFASGTINLASGINRILVGTGAADATLDVYYDDVAVNNSSGSFQNTYPGQGRIAHLKPNAAGDASDWTNDYLSVDEETPDDATTLAASNTANQIDDHNVESPSLFIGEKDVINVVSVLVRANIDNATGADPTFVLRIKASAGGTVEESSTISPTSTTWLTNNNSNVISPPLILYDLPGASTTAWTRNDLETAQIGYKETLTDTHNVQISTIWLLVDFTEAPPKKIGVKTR